jgi:hypothetical protein
LIPLFGRPSLWQTASQYSRLDDQFRILSVITLADPLEFLDSHARLEFKADPLFALLGLACTLDSAAHFLALAGINDLLGINGLFVNLLFQNFSVFTDQEVDATSGFVLVDVDAVLAGDISTPVTQKREGDADLVGKGFIGEGAVHAHTQNLGVGGFQRLDSAGTPSFAQFNHR